jgi:hypothetical protein
LDPFSHFNCIHITSCKLLPVNRSFKNCPISSESSHIPFPSSEVPNVNEGFKNTNKRANFLGWWGTSELKKVILEKFLMMIFVDFADTWLLHIGRGAGACT